MKNYFKIFIAKVQENCLVQIKVQIMLGNINNLPNKNVFFREFPENKIDGAVISNTS